MRDLEFYMGDAFEREGITAYACNSAVTSNNLDSYSKSISTNVDLATSFDKFCGGCVNFAASAEEAREALEKVIKEVSKLGAGVELNRANLKTLEGRKRYYV